MVDCLIRKPSANSGFMIFAWKPKGDSPGMEGTQRTFECGLPQDTWVLVSFQILKECIFLAIDLLSWFLKLKNHRTNATATPSFVPPIHLVYIFKKKYQKLVHNRCARCNLCNLYNTWHFYNTFTTLTILLQYFYNTYNFTIILQ